MTLIVVAILLIIGDMGFLDGLKARSVSPKKLSPRPGTSIMNFLHSEAWLDCGDQAAINLDSQANVMLMDDSNFSSYRAGHSFRYIGGLAERSPVRLAVPHTGHWNVVVDLGGYAGHVRAGVSFLRG